MHIRQHNVNFIAKKATVFPFRLRYNASLLYFTIEQTCNTFQVLLKNRNNLAA